MKKEKRLATKAEVYYNRGLIDIIDKYILFFDREVKHVWKQPAPLILISWQKRALWV